MNTIPEKETKFNYQKFIDRRIANVRDTDRMVFGLTSDLGPWIVPLAPALVFGYSFYAATVDRLDWMAVIAGAAAAFGMEIAGTTAFHTAVAFWSLKDIWKALTAFFLGILYVFIGIVGVVYLESQSAFVIVGVSAFILAPIVYASRALARDLNRQAQERQDNRALSIQFKQDEISFEREKELAAMRLKHEERLAKIEAKKEQVIAEAEAQARKLAGNLPETNGNRPESTGKLPEWLPVVPESKRQFVEMVRQGDIRLPDDVTGEDLSVAIDRTDRTARGWIAAARNGKH